MSNKFLIIGDSWGTGAWLYGDSKSTILKNSVVVTDIEDTDKCIYSIPDSGLDYFLTELGHSVVNISIPGSGNFLQLSLVEDAVRTHGPFDYIVWFQTEINRDILHIVLKDKHLTQMIAPSLLETAITKSTDYYSNFEKSRYKNYLDYVQNKNYQYAQDIYNTLGIPFILVGCLSPVTDHIKNYTFTHKYYESWIKDLTGVDVPRNIHSDYLVKILDQLGRPQDLEFLLEEIDTMTTVESYLESHIAFSNGVHPAKESFKLLATTLTELLE